MSGSAPTPRLFGRDGAATAGNPRTPDQMAAPDSGRNLAGGASSSDWWTMKPQRTSLATTTGQNLEGTKNAFDTSFWELSAAQDAEQKTVNGRWQRPDATGIVTYDSDREGVKFGDVFDGGTKVGNMYEGYAGMTTSDSDEIMARLILPREVWAKAYETEAGKPLTLTGNLSHEIQRQRDLNTRSMEKGLSAAAFEGEVLETAKGFEGSGAAQAANVGLGLGGGAVAGLGVAGVLAATGIGAPAAAVVAGVSLLGGLGSWLNRDEAMRSYATAVETWESATEDGHQALGYADAAAGLAGALGEKLNVTRNLLHGGYDAAAGEIGDSDSAYQNTTTPLWMQGADMAALLVDGIGSFGSAGARHAYSAILGAGATAEQASVFIGATEGNIAFNPYSGQYEDIGAGGMIQRQASVGIDILQTGAVNRLGRLLKPTGGRTTEGGWVVSEVDGVRKAERLGFSALIPSEAVVALGARTIARRATDTALTGAARKAELGVQTARALENLTTGRKSIAVMAVNGFGEGAEEFVQAALGATAFGEVPTFRELIEASKQGFAMGAGMGAALAIGSRSRSQMYLDRANTMRAVRGEELYTPAQWSKFTESEQAQAGTASTEKEAQTYDLAVTLMKREGGKLAAANYPEMQRAVEVARSITEQQARNSQELVEPSRLQVRSNHEWGAQDYVVSLGAAIRDVQARQQLMAATANGDVIRSATGQALTMDEQERASAAKIAESDLALLGRLTQAQAQIAATPELTDDVVAALNADLQSWWSSTDDLSYGKRRSASMWGARYPLNAAGSFQLLRLQISPELTAVNEHNTVLVPDEILPPTGGDFDGDRFVNMLRELLPDATYERLRHGAGQLTSQGTMLAAKPYVEAQVNRLFDAQQRPGTQEFIAAYTATGNIRARISSLLGRSPMPESTSRVVVGRLIRGLESRDPAAIARFFTELATRHAPAMRELAIALDSSPWLAMNRIIEDQMRIFQNQVALTTGATTRTGQTALPETSKNMPRWPAAMVRQSNDLLQGATVANKFDIFRLQTVLKYNARREATSTTPEETSDQLAELFRTFTARNDGIVRPGEDAMFDGTIAQDRVISWLTQIAREYRAVVDQSRPSGTTTTEMEALVLLAGADVDDVDWQNRRPRSEKHVRLIQAVLSEVVTRLRSEYAEVLGQDEAINSRLNSLEALTRPNYEDGAHTHAQGGDAFVEILGAFPIYELLGDQGANVNTWTVRGLRNHLLSLRADVREEFVDALQRHQSYGVGEGEQPSPYRVLIDNVVESARMQLTENRETGLPEGNLARASNMASENFGTTHHSLRNVLRMRGVDVSNEAALRAALENDVRLGPAILALIEERGVRAGTVLRDADGNVRQVQFQQWVYQVFTEPSRNRAEMILLRNTLNNAKLALGEASEVDAHSVNDRILRLWLDLDFRANDLGPGNVAARDARDTFLRLLGESDTVNAFIGGLNLDPRFRDERTPPYMAWSRDRSLITDDRFGRGVSDVQEGTEMREALRDAANVAATVLHDQEAVDSYLAENRELLAQLRAARDAGPGTPGAALWDRWTKWFSLARDLPTMMGISVMINQASHINEILGNMGVKGISPTNVAAMGKAIAAQLPTFDSAVGVLLGSLTSGSLGSVLTDTTQLARGERTYVLNDGTVVDWQGMTPERALDLLSDPDTAGVATRMLGLTAWDYNEDLDQNILVSIVGRGVAGFTTDPETSLFGMDQQAKFRRLMTIESMATTRGGPPIIPLLLATQMNVREAAVDHVISDKTGEREEMAVQILTDIADAFDALSRMRGLYAPSTDAYPMLSTVKDDDGNEMTLLYKTLLDASAEARQEKGVGNLMAQLLPVGNEDLRDATFELLRTYVAKFGLAAEVADDTAAAAVAAELKKQLDAADNPLSPLDVVLETYSSYDDPLTQALLVDRVRNAGDIANAAAWARSELLRITDPATPTVTMGGLILPNLTTKQWETVARAVIAFTMHTQYGIATRSDTEISVFPSLSNHDALTAQRGFWDPSFVEPAMDIFAPGLLRDTAAQPSPLLQAHLELTRTMGPQLSTYEPEEAKAAVAKLFRNTGQWHALLPALMHSAQGAVLASAAESAISMAGLNPSRLRYLAATTRQEWTRAPSDTELSVTTLPADQLITAVAQGKTLTSVLDVQLAGWQDPQQRPLAQLEGRVIRKLGITVAGQRYSLMGDQRYGSGLLLPHLPAGEGGVLTLKTFSDSVSSWLRDNNVPPARWGEVSIDVSFFHPDTKSVSVVRAAGANYDHNPWFDGVAARTDAAFAQESLVGSFFFGLDGVTPTAYEQALGAIKKLSFALQQVTEMPEATRRRITAMGLTNMSGMLDQLTDFAMRQKIDGRPLELTSYNAVRKILSLLYVVRYVEDGVVHVISTEEAIAKQMRGESCGPTAQVIGLPMQHVLTLMGEQGDSVPTVTPYGEHGWSPDVSRAEQYLRFPAQAWTPEMFGGLTAYVTDEAGNFLAWKTADLLQQPALRNQALPRVRVRSYKGQTKHSSKDYFGPFRKHQEQVFGDRARVPGKWAPQRAAVRELWMRGDTNVANRAMQAAQLIAEGSADGASVLRPTAPDVAPTNDFSTGWLYVHHGSKFGGVVSGVLTSPSEAGNATIGDEVIIQASTFVQPTGKTDLAEAFGTARSVLKEFMAVGATINLPTDPAANDLRRQMASHLRENGYAETERGSKVFVPQPTAARTQAQAAFEATLNGARFDTSTDRTLIDLSDHTPMNENSIYSVNGGIGSLETYDLREAVQTARLASYGPQLSPSNNQRQHLIDTLLPLLQGTAGVDYLAAQSGVDLTSMEDMREFARAIQLLEHRLIAARSDDRLALLPEPGEEFGTGDLIPLVSYNDRNELVAVHLYRHGHEPVDEQLITGASLPEGNAALTEVRLTIDKAKVDALHTSHRGEIISRDWRGLQGFVMRLRTNLGDLGSKVFESGTGMKWTTSPPPADLYIPSHAFFAGRGVLGAADLASPAAKTADGWWLNTPSRIVETVGFDTRPYLVRLLRGVTWEDGEQAYGQALTEVYDILSRFRATNVGSVDAATLITRSTFEFNDVLLQQLQARLADVLDTEVPEFFGPNATERIADLEMAKLVLSALAAGASLDEVIGAPGYVGQPAGTASHTMHPVFTSLLHQLPREHPARRAFVDQINARMPWDGGNGYELLPDLTWVRHVSAPTGEQYEIPTMLAFPRMRATDTNGVLSEMGQARRQRGDVSGTTLAMAFMTHGAVPMLEAQLNRGLQVFEENPYLSSEQGQRAFFFNYGVSASPVGARFDDDLRLNAREARHIFTTALPRRRALSVPIDTERWYADQSKATRRQNERAYAKAFATTLRTLRLSSTDTVYLTEMIRSVVARPATDPGELEFLTYREAMAALKLIQKNAERGDMPTHGGAVNVVSRAALARLNEVGYQLKRGDGTARPVATWDDWVDVMLSEAFSKDESMRGYPAVSNIVDGLLYEYRKDVKGLPATVQNRLQGVFAAVRARSGLLISSAVLRRELDRPSAQGGELVFDTNDFDSVDWEFEELPQDARRIVEDRMTTWENAHGLKRKRQSPRKEAIAGAEVREDLARTNVLMRFAQLGIVLKTLVNPGLWVSAFFELGLRGAQETVVSFLSGENVGAQGFTLEQRLQWNMTLSKLAKSPAFYGMVYEHTNYNPEGAPETRLEDRLQRYTNLATAMFNDPTWGISAKAMARTFMEATWDSVNKFTRDRHVTIEQFLDTLYTDPTALEAISVDAVAHGYSRIEYRRNLQDNLAERARRTIVEGVINSGGPGMNTLGTLFLRFPTLFFRFRSNTIINMLGLQGAHAVLAALMSDRTKRGGGLFSPRGEGGDESVSEQARIEDSYDLTRAMIRTGVSHTQLFILGMALSAAGFGGEDDEEKLLNKLRRYQKPIVAKNPLELENDFRNAEAWFSDLLPAGLGVPSWVIRPFVSPAMGIARFHETGDWRQVLWGFQDALGNLPLLNVDTVLNSWTVANELAAAAEATSQEDSEEATAGASRLLFTAVGTLEAMLFESAFASMIYQGADEWDRDPFKIPETNASGEVQTYGGMATGVPRPDRGLNEFVDPMTGEVRQGYASRNDNDAALHALAENRPVLATVLSMIMNDSSFIRYNMVPKIREVDAQELTQEEAAQIVVSTFTNESGEVLTHDGAAGVIRGIHLGTVSLDDPALGGIFIPKEMRFALQEQFLAELTQKYVDLGFAKKQALTEAKAEYYGQRYGEAEGLGLADIIWADQIPGYQTQTYLQLNTTYVMGPNGQPIATGLKRSVLDAVGMNLEGLGVFQTYTRGEASNMSSDQLLNSQDAGRGMNLGQRGLVKVDESWLTPTDEEIGDSINASLAKIADAIDDLSDQLDGGFNGYGGYGRGGYGGGGGGGYSSRADYGGQVVRLNTPRGFSEAYALSGRVVNPSNPILRRATVRRERFSSDRGRLNPWQ